MHNPNISTYLAWALSVQFFLLGSAGRHRKCKHKIREWELNGKFGGRAGTDRKLVCVTTSGI